MDNPLELGDIMPQNRKLYDKMRPPKYKGEAKGNDCSCPRSKQRCFLIDRKRDRGSVPRHGHEFGHDRRELNGKQKTGKKSEVYFSDTVTRY